MNMMTIKRDKLTDSCLRAANEKRLTDIEKSAGHVVSHLRSSDQDLPDDLKHHVATLESLIDHR